MGRAEESRTSLVVHLKHFALFVVYKLGTGGNHYRLRPFFCVAFASVVLGDATPRGIGFFLIRESSRFPIAGYREARQPLRMASRQTITESGVLYDVQHSVKKRARFSHRGGPRPKATRTSFGVPRLLRMLRWLERYSPPRVRLTFVADSQPETPIKVSETKDTGKDGSRDGANNHPDVVRVVRKVPRVR